MYTKEQANTLTPAGFYRYWKGLVDSGLKQEAAYDATESIHAQVDLAGRRKYQTFDSFIPRIYSRKKLTTH